MTKIITVTGGDGNAVSLRNLKLISEKFEVDLS